MTISQINTIILVGRAGNHPEIKHFESGKTMASFNLAVDRPRKAPDAETQTDWFKIELWGRQAEVAFEYVKKGSLVGIRGSLHFRQISEHYTEFYILNHYLRLLGSKHDLVPPKAEQPF